MGKDSRIGWTHHTFNPWWGCVKVSPACKNCYAEGTAARWRFDVWGTDARRKFQSEKYWTQPLRWNHAAEKAGERHRVFVASMADVFEQLSVKHPDWLEMARARAMLWDLIQGTPNLDWLLLTKRPENIAPLVPWGHDLVDVEPWPNVWLGVTAENQAEADSRIPFLLDVPAAVRFVSYEPALEKLLLDDGATSWLTCDGRKLRGNGGHCCEAHDIGGTHFRGIDWVIAGCESGPRKREMDINWVRSVRDQCARAGASFFFKQAIDIDGKKIEAPYLDGRQWQEVPNAQA